MVQLRVVLQVPYRLTSYNPGIDGFPALAEDLVPRGLA